MKINEQKTMENRFNAIMELEKIINIAEAQTRRAREIPLLDDDEHADWVQGFADRIHEIRLDMEDLAGFGHANMGE